VKWDSSTLEEVAEINPRLTATPKPGDLVTFVPMSAVSEQSLAIVNGEDRRFDEIAKGYTQFQRGDIIIAKITPCFQNGKMAHATNLEHPVAVGSTEFHVFRPRRSLYGASSRIGRHGTRSATPIVKRCRRKWLGYRAKSKPKRLNRDYST
jgi:type I restriction enzyme, S subunit